MDEILKAAPLIALSLLFLALLFLAREAGSRIRLRQVAAPAPDSSGNAEGYVISAVLGLLALLVGFTFGLALSRFEERRSLVVVEANALGTFYLRTALLPSPGPVRSLARAYGEERLLFARKDDAGEAAVTRRTRALQQDLWQATVKALEPERRTPVTMLVLTPLNEAFDTATARTAERQARLPGAVVATLLLYSLAAAGVVGHAAPGKRLRTESYVLFGLLTLSITLILDLDQPLIGSIRVPHAAMEDAVHAMAGPTPMTVQPPQASPSGAPRPSLSGSRSPPGVNSSDTELMQ